MSTLAIVLFLHTAFGQVVLVGQRPTQAESEDYCNKIEQIRPNLELQQPVHITGRVTDITDVPLKKSRLEPRKYISKRKQITVKVATTDESGYFDLGTVEKGPYRFLASPHRGFKQPTKLECSSEKCELKIALQVNATDQPDSACPIR
jgi:hypothetical protein